MQSFFIRVTKTLIRLRWCAGWSESSLGAHVRRYIFSHCASIIFRQIMSVNSKFSRNYTKFATHSYLCNNRGDHQYIKTAVIILLSYWQSPFIIKHTSGVKNVLTDVLKCYWSLSLLPRWWLFYNRCLSKGVYIYIYIYRERERERERERASHCTFVPLSMKKSVQRDQEAFYFSKCFRYSI